MAVFAAQQTYKLREEKAVSPYVATTFVCHSYSSTAQDMHHKFQKEDLQ